VILVPELETDWRKDWFYFTTPTVRFQRAVALCEARLGKAHLDHARRLGRLARVPYDNGDFESAESIQREVLAFRTRVLDRNHTEVIANTLNGLGIQQK
jgi:hypothetical protein